MMDQQLVPVEQSEESMRVYVDELCSTALARLSADAALDGLPLG